MNTLNNIVLIAYSGHAYVVCDVILSNEDRIIGYCDNAEKNKNPYQLSYLGIETEEKTLNKIRSNSYFTAIGNNKIRAKVTTQIIKDTLIKPLSIIHKSAWVSSTVCLQDGVLIAGGCHVNACVQLDHGVICNTGSIIEHECSIGEYSHIAPGAVLCGNVSVGSFSFIGARSVVKEGVKIGNNVTIGAGSVIIRDIPDNSKVVGNPQRLI